MGFWGRRKADEEVPGWHEFYQRFEDRFRGSAKHITATLQSRYEVPTRLLGQSFGSTSGIKHIDLGCGRGELMHLTAGWNFAPVGVDTNLAACQRCRSQGLTVVNEDILSFLRRQPSDSAGMISSLHVIEHCPPQYFWQVVRESYRCLRSGGVLLVETPSLYCLYVGARQFYLDPTHSNPIHPDYLRFLAEDTGFTSTKLLQFDPVDAPEVVDVSRFAGAGGDEKWQAFQNWLFGSMDIALWAVK